MEAESKNDPLTAPIDTAAKFLFGEIPMALPRMVPPTAPEPWKGNITNTIMPVTEALSNQGKDVNIAFPFSWILVIPLPINGIFFAKSKFQVKKTPTAISTNAVATASDHGFKPKAIPPGITVPFPNGGTK